MAEGERSERQRGIVFLGERQKEREE